MNRGWWIGIALLLLCTAFFSFKAGDIRLQFTGDENFYFESSRQMLEEGDWITPQYYGKKRFQKPFLFYWLIGLSFKIFGVNWWAARFPSVLLGAFAVLCTYLLGRELFGRPAGIFSSMVLATSLKFFKYTRAAVPDMALLFFITAAFYFFIKGRNNPEKKGILFLLVFVASGLATLTKGPIGLLIPLLVIVFFIVASKERNIFRELRVGRGVFLYLLITAPWLLLVFKLHGSEYINHIWTREILQRVLYFSETKHGVGLFLEYIGSLFFYVPIIIVRFLPWSLFLPVALINSFSLCKNKGLKKEPLFVLLWFFVVFIFFSLLGEKHSQYILALSPPLALIIGAYFWQSAKAKKLNLAVPVSIFLVLVLVFISAFSFPLFQPNSAILAKFASRIIEYDSTGTYSVACGSHDLIPQHLEVHIGRPAEKISRNLYDPVENERLNKYLLKQFFTRKERGFCLIKKEDFLNFVDAGLRKKLYVIAKDLLWKRKFSLKDRKLKDEYWLVTNKR